MQLSRHNPALALDIFPASYRQACRRWEDLLTQLVYPVAARDFVAPGDAPDGGALQTQTAWIGPADAARVLVLIAGTHGVEGYTGSAIQCDFLRLLQSAAFPDDFAILLVHALTPWGYAWDRRCDDVGIDLNRNFVDFDQPLPDNPGYRELQPWLQEADPQRRNQVFVDYISRHGREAFEFAVSGGQYNDPAGPFFGGHAPGHGRLVTEELISTHKLAGRLLGVIDLHTGLGPWGYGEVICDHAPDSDGTRTAQAWYGAACTLPALGTSSSVVKAGLLDYAWHAIMPAHSCYITLEFGTYSTESLFNVLLEDHQYWRQNPEDGIADPAREHSAQAMRMHFYPADPAWRELVLFRARQVIDQTLAGLLS